MNGLSTFLFLCLGGVVTGSIEARAESQVNLGNTIKTQLQQTLYNNPEDKVQILAQEFKNFTGEVSSQFRIANLQIQEANSQIQEANSQIQEANSQIQEANLHIKLLTKKVEELKHKINNNTSDCVPKAKAEEMNTTETTTVTVKACNVSLNARCFQPPLVIPIHPGEPKNISVTFNLHQHPVDVYYLLYATLWNQNEIQSLIESSDNLTAALANMSYDHTLGFGTFIDKPDSRNKGYYSYYNSYPLSPDTNSFKSALEATHLRNRVFPHLDSRADAIYQAVNCAKVGWRPHARHVLVVIPGTDYNVAGKGKNFYPPITTPFDERCHLNRSGYYSKELEMDYPSEEQVLDVVDRSKTNVIFHVWSGSSKKNTHEGLAAKAKTSAWSLYSTAEPSAFNLIQLLVDDYNKIGRAVELEHTKMSDIRVSCFSECNGGSWEETNVCDDIGERGEVTFILQLNVTRCPSDPEEKTVNITVNPVGLPTSLNISLQLLCGN